MNYQWPINNGKMGHVDNNTKGKWFKELLELIYQKTDRMTNMVDKIKDTANYWMTNNPSNKNEIIEHIIDNINI